MSKQQVPKISVRIIQDFPVTEASYVIRVLDIVNIHRWLLLVILVSAKVAYSCSSLIDVSAR